MTRVYPVICGFVLVLLAVAGCSKGPDAPPSSTSALRLQLNWFHDPTFVGEYRAAEVLGSELAILEGGTNVSSLQRLKAGLADVAVAGIDLALQAIEIDLMNGGSSDYRIIFADFQRNPVGWVVHPDAASRIGFSEQPSTTDQDRNDWFFSAVKKGQIHVGDKRGTETTAVWARWSQVREVRDFQVTPVGFDPTIVLSAPALAYPVYLNEEPFKLSEKLGRAPIVLDPAADGVALLGNVLVTTTTVLENKKAKLLAFLSTLQEAWEWSRSEPQLATSLVRNYYKQTSDSVLQRQIVKTTEFVFSGASKAGRIEVAAGSRLDQTVKALRDAKLLKSDLLDLSLLSKLVVPLPDDIQ